MLAKELGYTPKEVAVIKKAMKLHDIGKSKVPKAVLNKIGRLTEMDKAIIQTHETRGVEIIEKYFNVKDPKMLEIIKGHGKQGESRLCAIAQMVDQFDALVSPRVYRKALPPTEAFKIIIEKNIPEKQAPALAKNMNVFNRFVDLYKQGKLNNLIKDSRYDR